MINYKPAQRTIFVLLLLAGITGFEKKEPVPFDRFLQDFHEGYTALNIPFFEFDYRRNFAQIAGKADLEKQKAFFEKTAGQLNTFDTLKLSARQKLHYDHLAYQVRLNLERIGLEKKFTVQNEKNVPENGLSQLDKGWYPYYIRFYTSVDISPEALFAFGKKEVLKVQHEIKRIRAQLGYGNDSAGFYAHLQSATLLLDNKDSVIARYEKIKKTVLNNLGHLFEDTRVNDLLFMEWPGADQFTPPGYYSPAEDNAYDHGVFYFNFFDHRHNTRSMDWLFIHEGVPGHHYQWCLKQKIAKQPDFIHDFYYSGNFEGWGAYVEYLGKEIGLYRDPYAELGKWEWDLVRSVRILIDVGIHHYGWGHDEALACWKKYIPGQDAIAEREIKRCTSWPAQALSYKVGADRIRQMSEKLKASRKNFSIKKFHTAYLAMGSAPMEVIEKDIDLFME